MSTVYYIFSAALFVLEIPETKVSLVFSLQESLE